MTKLITYPEYMANSAELHHAFHLQFVTPALMARVKRVCKLDVLKSSESPYFNDVYPLAHWDNIAGSFPGDSVAKMREAGEYPTPATKVCVLKAAARHWVESEGGNNAHISTSNFETLVAAVKYYAAYGYSSTDVMRKVLDKEIVIGRPEARAGYKLMLDSDKRYFFEVM